jgi:hypothetical protein
MLHSRACTSGAAAAAQDIRSMVAEAIEQQLEPKVRRRPARPVGLLDAKAGVCADEGFWFGDEQDGHATLVVCGN